LSAFKAVVEKCHIYLIGLVPKVEIVGSSQTDQILRIDVKVLGENYSLEWEIPIGCFRGQSGHQPAIAYQS
jgi:hypothetical protein